MCTKPPRSTEDDTHREGAGRGRGWGSSGADWGPELFSVCLTSPAVWASVGVWRPKHEFRLLDWPRLRGSDNNRPMMNDNCVFSTSVFGNLFIDLDYKFWKPYIFNDFFFPLTLKGSVLFQPCLCLNFAHWGMNPGSALWN